MLCVALTSATLDEIFGSDITGADCVEVRLDYLNNPQQSFEASWSRIGVPVIATCRRRERGGLFNGSIAEERRILEAAARQGAKFVDIDYRDARSIAGTELIASYHDFEKTPADAIDLLQAACVGPSNIVKLAATVRSWSDNRRLLALLDRKWPKPIIVAGMGEMGQITRLIGPSRGSFLTYATIAQPGGPSASGQLTLSDMLGLYHFRRLHRTTKLFGVIGNPVIHSSGPLRHNPAFESANLDFAYLKLLVTDVRDFFENAAAIGIQGFSVTMPHKIAVMPFLLKMSTAAQDVGAVNTVVWKEGGWYGDNTDVDGVRAALEFARFDPTGKRVVILGNKGAARAGAAALKKAANVVMLPRAEVPNAGEHECDLLINATPVGMVPNVDASPVEGRIPAQVVFDMVYNPPMTRFLQLAKQQGKSVVPGTIMYDAQAARQFQIWTGQNPPAGMYESKVI